MAKAKSKAEIIQFHDEDFHSYVFVNEAGQQVCRFEIDNVYEKQDGVWGEVTLWYLFEGDPERPIISHARQNMLTTVRKGDTDLLYETYGEVFAWDRMLQTVRGMTVEAVRVPVKPEALEIIGEDEYPPFLVEPFILDRGVSLFFGPGGTGKSMIALSAAIAVASGRTVFGRKPTQTGPVLYIDYEEPTKAAHDRRMGALLDGLGIGLEDLEHDILWVKPRQPIAKIRRQLKTYMREYKPALIIVDSVGLARGGNATEAEATIALFSVLSSLDCAVFAIDHVTKDDQRQKAMVTPYGSIYTVNSVRLAWSVMPAVATTEGKTYLVMKQTKRNHVAAHDALGGEITFANDMVEFEGGAQPILRSVKVNLTDMWWDTDGSSAIDKAVDYLETHGPTPAGVIARGIGVNVQSLSKKLRDFDGVRVKRVSASSNPVIWALNDG